MALTQVNAGLIDSTSQPNSFKNRIINGAMMIDQRNAGASVTPTTDNYYTLDRWIARLTQASKYSVQQVADAPDGLLSSLKVTSTSSYSLGASDYFQVGQYIEGLNAYDLMWGTSSAKSVTVSFWAKSSLTGTFGGTIFGYQTGVPSYPFSYTINAANTWEYKTITVAGPTSGTFNTNNNGCFVLLFSFGVGSSLSGTANTWNYSTLYRAPTGATSVVGTNGATFYITGVQLEKGSTATSFDYRPYGAELALCQRYALALNDNSHVGSGVWYTANAALNGMEFPVTMRATPTLTTNTAVLYIYYGGGAILSASGASSVNIGSKSGCSFYTSTVGSATQGQGATATVNAGMFVLSAEL